MEEKLTLEQALQNIRVILDNYKGTKQEHLIIDESLQLVKDTIYNNCTCKTEDKE